MNEKENDFEQLYYDEVYKYKELSRKYKNLEEENEIYKSLLNCQPKKKMIAEILIKYIRGEKSGKK